MYFQNNIYLTKKAKMCRKFLEVMHHLFGPASHLKCLCTDFCKCLMGTHLADNKVTFELYRTDTCPL